MSDGHLYLDDGGVVALVAEPHCTWLDETHGSLLVLSWGSRQLREVALTGTSAAHRPPSTSSATTARSMRRSTLARRTWSSPSLGIDHLDDECALMEHLHLRSREQEDEDDDDDDEEDAAAADDKRDCGVRVLYPPPATATKAGAGGGGACAPPRLEPPIALARLSVDRAFVALQRSDIEVQVVHVATGASHFVLCRGNAGNRILHGGVLWSTHGRAPESSQDLVLVTRLGLEHYRVSAKRGNCVLHRTIGVFVHAFWYAAPQRMLVVSTGARANELVPFRVDGANIERLPRLVFSAAIGRRDLYLAPLYGDLYAVYGDQHASRLLLYRIDRHKVSCVRSLHLLLPPGSAIELSVVDDLLVCHSVQFNVSFFFDVRCEANVHDAFSHPLPISLGPPRPRHLRRAHTTANLELPHRADHAPADHAMPVLPVVGDEFHAFVSNDGEPRDDARLPSIPKDRPIHVDHHQNGSPARPPDATHKASSHWTFLSPDLVQRNFDNEGDAHEHFEIRRLRLNLDRVTQSCAQHPDILCFLLRRGDQERAKRLALKIVGDKLSDQVVSPMTASTILAMVQTMSQAELEALSDDSSNDTSSDDDASSGGSRYRPPMPVSIRKHLFRDSRGQDTSAPCLRARMTSRNAQGLTLISQSDFASLLWRPMLERAETINNGQLPAYIGEFIKNLRQHAVPVEDVTYKALVDSYIISKKFNELAQLIQYRLPADSLELARSLVNSSQFCPLLWQLSLDMYQRLSAYSELIQTLLDHHQVERAISISWRNMGSPNCDSATIPGHRFFEATVRSCSLSD